MGGSNQACMESQFAQKEDGEENKRERTCLLVGSFWAAEKLPRSHALTLIMLAVVFFKVNPGLPNFIELQVSYHLNLFKNQEALTACFTP